MTAATAGPSDPNLFSTFSVTQTGLFRKNPEALVLSLVGQAAMLGILIYFTTWVIEGPPDVVRHPVVPDTLRVIFSGNNGGGGGNHDPLPASHGNIPKASLADQIVPPTVVVQKEMPKLPMPETVVVALTLSSSKVDRLEIRSRNSPSCRMDPVVPVESGRDAVTVLVRRQVRTSASAEKESIQPDSTV